MTSAWTGELSVDPLPFLQAAEERPGGGEVARLGVRCDRLACGFDTDPAVRQPYDVMVPPEGAQPFRILCACASGWS